MFGSAPVICATCRAWTFQRPTPRDFTVAEFKQGNNYVSYLPTYDSSVIRCLNVRNTVEGWNAIGGVPCPSWIHTCYISSCIPRCRFLREILIPLGQKYAAHDVSQRLHCRLHEVYVLLGLYDGETGRGTCGEERGVWAMCDRNTPVGSAGVELSVWKWGNAGSGIWYWNLAV